MIPFILAFLIAFVPIPPLGATLGSNVQKTHNAPVVSEMKITQLPVIGWATYYAPSLFETVVRNQIANDNIQPNDCPDCDGFAALLWPSDVGRVVCVQGLRLWVVDSAADHHRTRLIEQGWVVDVDRETWLALSWPDTPIRTKVTECS